MRQSLSSRNRRAHVSKAGLSRDCLRMPAAQRTRAALHRDRRIQCPIQENLRHYPHAEREKNSTSGWVYSFCFLSGEHRRPRGAYVFIAFIPLMRYCAATRVKNLVNAAISIAETKRFDPQEHDLTSLNPKDQVRRDQNVKGKSRENP